MKSNVTILKYYMLKGHNYPRLERTHDGHVRY